jgi:signal transduction histidine kinase
MSSMSSTSSRVRGLLAKMGAAFAAPVRGRRSQLQEANEQLVQVALTAQDLQSAAERAHRLQAEFMAVLAHELRSPLMPIRTAAGLLGRLPAGELSQVQAVIERQVAHLSRLVDDLLDVSRMVTGKLRLDIGSVDLADTIEQAVGTCRPAMDARHQHLQVALPSHALPMRGDPLRLAQVVNNLLDNASRYAPDGGMIALSAVVVGRDIVMTVSDNGIGIAAEALPRVFEPFVQDVHATRFNGAGLGIGLALVRELVEGHGGSVVASSAGSGLGSQFVVTLPLAGVGADG